MIETLLIVLSVVIILLLVVTIILLLKRRDGNSDRLLKDLKSEYYNLQLDFVKLVNESSTSNQTNLNSFKDDLSKRIDDNLRKVNEEVNKQLGEGFKGTQKTFVSVTERLAKIDEAQKQIEKISGEVVSLNDVLTNKNTRGVFGEVQLYQILDTVFGSNNTLYEQQKTLSNNRVADSVVYAPEPLGMIAIDSKFPLNAYENMASKDSEDSITVNQFERRIKSHIDDIANRYIIDGETSDYAILFIPAEAIFAEINAKHFSLVEYGMEKNVWITSPTTLIASLSIIQTIIHNIKRAEQTDLIIEELKKLGIEFDRFKIRFEGVNNRTTQLLEELRTVGITATKISDRFNDIENANF